MNSVVNDWVPFSRLETVKILLKKHPNLIDAYRPTLATGSCLHTTTPLHSASRNGHRAVVDVLLRAGFPVSLQTPDGTALHEATSCGKVGAKKSLGNLLTHGLIRFSSLSV